LPYPSQSDDKGNTVFQVDVDARGDLKKKGNWSEFLLEIAQNIDSEDRSKQSSGIISLRKFLSNFKFPFSYLCTLSRLLSE